MANRYDDEYSDDDIYDDEEYPEDEFDEEEFADTLKNRLIIQLSSSFGISILIHVIILLIMASIIIGTNIVETKKNVVLQKRPRQKREEYDPEKKRSLVTSPEIPKPENDVQHQQDTMDDPNPIPLGSSMDNATNVEQQNSSVITTMGIGAGASGAYGNRSGHGSLGREGGSAATQNAVYAALRWLARHQNEDGSWSCHDFRAQCNGGSDHCGVGPAESRGYEDYDVGVTGLALLAFLGYGITHQEGEFKSNVRKGMNYLRRIQNRQDGSLGFIPDDPTKQETFYNHCIATMALCELLAVSGDEMIRRDCERAVDYCIKARNNTGGEAGTGFGWRYGYRTGENDTSVTGWMVLALKTARAADITVPDEAFAGARAWFDKVTHSEDRPLRAAGWEAPPGWVGYLQKGDPGSVLPEHNPNSEHYMGTEYAILPTMTAVAAICRIFTNQSPRDREIRMGIELLMNNLPVWEHQEGSRSSVNMYYWYYGTYALFQYGGRDWFCGAENLQIYGEGDDFDKCRGRTGERLGCWNHVTQRALLPTQRQGVDNCLDGSWDPVGDWGIAGGRVYSTAINALTLEIYYRYARMTELSGH